MALYLDPRSAWAAEAPEARRSVAAKAYAAGSPFNLDAAAPGPT